LFHWSYQYSGSFLTSFAMVVVVAGTVVFLGGLAASRLLAVFSRSSLYTHTGLWIGLDASHYNSADMPYSDLRIGAWLTIGGGLIELISGFVVRRSLVRPVLTSPRRPRTTLAAGRESGPKTARRPLGPADSAVCPRSRRLDTTGEFGVLAVVEDQPG